MATQLYRTMSGYDCRNKCVFSFCLSDEMLRVMGQTGRRQVDSYRVVGQQQQKSDRR